MASRGWKILAAFLAMTCTCLSVLGDEAVLAPPAHVTEASILADKYEALTGDFRSQLEQLATARENARDVTAAVWIRRWLVPQRSDRTTIYFPSEAWSIVPVVGRNPGQPNDIEAWLPAFETLRAEHAARLWDNLVALHEAGAWTDSIRRAWEVLFFDSSHAKARHLVGADAFRGAQTAASSMRLSTGPSAKNRIPLHMARNDHPSLGWKAGTYWTIKSPHFAVSTQFQPSDMETTLAQLEQLFIAWRQLFPGIWTNVGDLTKVLRGGGWPHRDGRYEIAIFGDKAAYVQYLQAHEPQVEITLGMYRAKDRRSYFYGDPRLNFDTLRHEVTHQLFQEEGNTRLGAGESSDFWLIEGIAMYMESLRTHPGYCTIGGWDAPRLQHARFRALLAGEQIPFRELRTLGRIALQQHPDIRGLYSQSAGLTYYFMDYENGKYRDSLRECLATVYTRKDPPAPLETLADRSAADFDREYQTQFLPVTDLQLTALTGDESLTKLCLGRSPIHDDALRNLARCDTSTLTWLDLTDTSISDEGLTWLKGNSSLRQMGLEGTSVSDALMSQLRDATALEELDLSRTGISDEGLKILRPKPELRTLWLTSTAVTDEGMRELTGMAKLQLLNVSGTHVTAAGRKWIESQIPGLTVTPPVSQ